MKCSYCLVTLTLGLGLEMLTTTRGMSSGGKYVDRTDSDSTMTQERSFLAFWQEMNSSFVTPGS